VAPFTGIALHRHRYLITEVQDEENDCNPHCRVRYWTDFDYGLYRCHAHTSPNAYSHTNAHTYPNTYAYSHTNAHTYPNTYAYSHTNTNTNTNTRTNGHHRTDPNVYAFPHTYGYQCTTSNTYTDIPLGTRLCHFTVSR